ncbi:MAG: hypothetical protein LBL59_04760 [Xanthomonadaceae bacterium]|nr:hypothetical protein [Xanthomonadaceae bacterium]
MSDPPPAAVAFPDPGSVIYFIFGEKGDGSSSYETVNRSLTTYWYGFPFELDGKRYFSGFVYSGPQKFGEFAGEAMAVSNHETQATISVATFEASVPGSEKPWDFLGAQLYVGDLGRNYEANAIDEDRRPVTYLANDGRYFLAIPTSYLAGGGVNVRTFEVFAMSRGEDGMLWKYLGSVGGGAENNASCDSGPDSAGLPACFDSRGSLAFRAGSDDVMPGIQVLMQGTNVDASGKVVPVHAGAVTEYLYDSGRSKYRQVEHSQ